MKNDEQFEWMIARNDLAKYADLFAVAVIKSVFYV